MGTHEALIVGATVVGLDPQELRPPSAAISPKKKRGPPQRNFSRHKWKFGSNTRNPPARTTLIFLKNIRSLLLRRAPLPASQQASKARTRTTELPSDASIRRNVSVCRLKKYRACWNVSGPSDRALPPPLKTHIRTNATNRVASRLGSWTESHSPRGIDAVPHRCVA